MSFFSKTRIKATELFEDSFEYLQRTYDQAIETFTPASPFGQVLTVVSNLGELIFFYIESIATESNIPRARNIESIYGLSRLTGHDPTRGISSRGIIGLRLNTSASTLLNGDYVQIMNGASLEISQNNLTAFRGRKGAASREESIFDAESREYFLSKNMPKDANPNNLFNNRLPMVLEGIGGMTIYDYIEFETMGSISRGQNLEEYYEGIDENIRKLSDQGIAIQRKAAF